MITSVIITIGRILDQLSFLKAFDHHYYLQGAILLDMTIFSVTLIYIYGLYPSPNPYVKLDLHDQKLESDEKITKEDNDKDNVYFIKQSGGYQRILVSDILFIKAEGSYAHLYLTGEANYTISKNLKQLILEINSPYLVRVHRSYVVNKKAIEKKSSTFIFIDNYKIPVGRSYAEEVKGI